MNEKLVNSIRRRLNQDQVQFIDLKYPALTGSPHHITIEASRFDEIIKDGVGMDGSSIPGYKGVSKSDMLIFPDLGTYFLDPSFEARTASFLCHIFTVNPIEPFERDCRYIIRRTADYLQRVLKCEAFFLPELEFYIFDKANFGEGPGYGFFRIASDEQESDGITFPIRPKGGYHTSPPEDKHHDFRNALVHHLSRCGIRTKYHHHEVGPYGQMEIELLFQPLIRSADELFLAKYLIRNFAQRQHKWVTFMPKPLHGEPGNGLHLHQFLGRPGHSLFFDPDKKDNLSDICRHYIGGILRHSRALCALTNPSTNSYKRLIPGFEAPTYTDFSFGSRTSAIRVPAYIKNKKMTDIEYRIPDATANPYFAMAAIVLAGIDGIQKKIKPDLREPLPVNTQEALAALEKDHQFLLQDKIFAPSLINRWIEVKGHEFEEVHQRPHPHEFQLYFGA